MGYDMNPTVDGRDPEAYAKYARRLDSSLSDWWAEDLDRMAPELAKEAMKRRAVAAQKLPAAPTVVNPDSIGDPNQTPVVYIGDAGKALGIPERAGQALCLDRMQALAGEREYVCTLPAGHDQHTQSGTGTGWVHGPADALLADLDAARQERDEARATLSIVEENFHEVEAERDSMVPVVEAAREVAHAWRESAGLFARQTPEFKGFLAAAEAYETQHLRQLIAQQFAATVDAYENQEGTE